MSEQEAPERISLWQYSDDWFISKLGPATDDNEVEYIRVDKMSEICGRFWGEMNDAGMAALKHAKAEADLRAENERLRAALRDIAHGPVGYWNHDKYAKLVISNMMATADKALKLERER